MAVYAMLEREAKEPVAAALASAPSHTRRAWLREWARRITARFPQFHKDLFDAHLSSARTRGCGRDRPACE